MLANLSIVWTCQCLAQEAGTNYAAQLNIGLVRGFPGKSVPVPFLLANTGAVAAAQFDLAYPNLHLAPGNIIGGNLDSSTVLRWREISPGVIRYVVYSRENLLLRTNAQLGYLPVDVPASETAGGRLTPGNLTVVGQNGSLFQPVQARAGGVQVSQVFRAEDSTVSLLFMVESNRLYVVQATTNFASWLNISTNLAIDNYFTVVDSDAVNFPFRYYRAVPEGAGPRFTVDWITRETNGVVSLQVSGEAGRNLALQASTNLVSWQSISTNALAAGQALFVDPNAGNYRARYYRMLLLP